jgi:hypothetical protein
MFEIFSPAQLKINNNMWIIHIFSLWIQIIQKAQRQLQLREMIPPLHHQFHIDIKVLCQNRMRTFCFCRKHHQEDSPHLHLRLLLLLLLLHTITTHANLWPRLQIRYQLAEILVLPRQRQRKEQEKACIQ